MRDNKIKLRSVNRLVDRRIESEPLREKNSTYLDMGLSEELNKLLHIFVVGEID